MSPIVHGVLNALEVIGVWNAFLPGQIMGWLGDKMAGNTKVMPPIDRTVPDWITKPLFECPMCCASVHGIAWWAIFHHIPLVLLPVYIVCLSGTLKLIAILVLDKDS